MDLNNLKLTAQEAQGLSSVMCVDPAAILGLIDQVDGSRFAARQHLSTVEAQKLALEAKDAEITKLTACVLKHQGSLIEKARELDALAAPREAPEQSVPAGWQLVPVEPTEDMVVDGFESAPCEGFTSLDEWEKFEAMSGCQQSTHRARLCYAAMLAATPTPPAAAPDADERAVDRFATAMKAKMAVSSAKGRSGWNDEAQCTMETLARMLLDHVRKGDPVDIANFAMMLHQREASAIEHHPCNGGQAAQAIRAASALAAPKCSLCGDRGSYVIGTSGDASDGNAPVFERCDCDAAFPVAAPAPSLAAAIELVAAFESSMEGCTDKSWSEWQNGNGDNVGQRIEAARKVYYAAAPAPIQSGELSPGAERSVDYIMAAVQSFADQWRVEQGNFGNRVEALNTKARIRRMLEDDARKLTALAAPAAAQEQAKENAVAQAQQWAQEAKSQRSTVLEILRYFGLPENDYEALSLIKAKQEQAKPTELLTAAQVIEFGATLIGHASDTDGMDDAEGKAWVRARLSKWMPEAAQETKPTDISQRLRAIASRVTQNNPALVTPECLRAAADEIDRLSAQAKPTDQARELTDADIERLYLATEPECLLFAKPGQWRNDFARAIARHLASPAQEG